MSSPNYSHAPTADEVRDVWCEQGGERPPGAEGPLAGPSQGASPEAPASRPGVEDALAWGTVRTGIGLVPIGVWVIFTGMVAMLVSMRLGEQRPLPTGLSRSWPT